MILQCSCCWKASLLRTVEVYSKIKAYRERDTVHTLTISVCTQEVSIFYLTQKKKK